MRSGEDVVEEDPAELARRIAAGDSEAENRFVEHFSRGLLFLLRRLTGDPALADDLHQETLRIALEKVRGGKLREPDRLAAFVRGTARNLVLAERRKVRRRPEVELDAAGEPADPLPGTLRRLEREDDRRRVRRLLGELRSDRDRQLLLRFHLAGEPREKICADLGLERRQFNVAIFRARQRFKQLFEEAAPEIGGPGTAHDKRDPRKS